MSKVKVNVVDISKQSKVRVKPIKRANHIHFPTIQTFRPNLSPKDVLQMGSFGVLIIDHNLFSSCRTTAGKSTS